MNHITRKPNTIHTCISGNNVFGLVFTININTMKVLKDILSIFVVVCILMSSNFIQAQDYKHNLVVYGKVLQGEKSDIMIFRKENNDWNIIRTMKSRTIYNLELNLEHNHYVVFKRNDGLVKALYVNQNKNGEWEMNFDVVFSDFPDEEIKIYKKTPKEIYKYINFNKFNELGANSKEIELEDLITVK
jgi:hypothetical protein